MLMQRKHIKWGLWIVASPWILFSVAIFLLYLPPVQNYACRKATQLATEASGFDVSVGRIRLHFPLNLVVNDIQVVQTNNDSVETAHSDTLLTLDAINIRIQALPLFRARVEIDEATLERASVNSADLIEGMLVKGEIGHFSLSSHGIDLLKEDATLNRVDLQHTHLFISYTDTAAADTTSLQMGWKVRLKELSVKDLSCQFVMPFDTLDLSAQIGNASASDAEIDLNGPGFRLNRFILNHGFASCQTDHRQAAAGFDPSHIQLRDINAQIDSLYYYGRNIRAVMSSVSMNERSGLCISDIHGKLYGDSVNIDIPLLALHTPHSEIGLKAHTTWDVVESLGQGDIAMAIDAYIGKQDVMLLAGDLPETFKKNYPNHPLVMHAAVNGTTDRLPVSRLQAQLPSAFNLEGSGVLENICDSVHRAGILDIKINTQDLNFLTGLAGITPGGDIAVPDSMLLNARMNLSHSTCSTLLNFIEQQGQVELNATYNLSDDTYQASLNIDQLNISHFLPHDSVYTLSAAMEARGQGTDLFSRRTSAQLNLQLLALQYGPRLFENIKLDANLRHGELVADVTSDNEFLKLQSHVSSRLNSKYIDCDAQLDVRQIALYDLGLLPAPIDHPFAFSMHGQADKDSIRIGLNAGDLTMLIRARSSLNELVEQSMTFKDVLLTQIDHRHLNHAELRQALPKAGVRISAGKKNPVYDILKTQHIRYNDFQFGFGFTPELGINGRTAIHGLRYDSLQIDTVYFRIAQDTTRMAMQGGIINGSKNPQIAFRSTLDGEIGNEDAHLLLSFKDKNDVEGVNFGIKAKPLVEGNGKGNGLLLNLIPEEPIIVYRKFHFKEKQNWIYLHKNMRVYANIDMDSDNGLGFKMKSNREDTVSLQNIALELDRLPLSNLSDVLPYLPKLGGLFSLETQYVQTEQSLQISSEATIQHFAYEGQPVGDLGLGATWLPGENGIHYANSYMTFNGEEVIMANGTYRQQDDRDMLSIDAMLERFPLQMANAFIPDRMVSFTGIADGNVTLSGSSDKPAINGELLLDSVSLFIRQAGARYWFDNRPVQLVNNQLRFDKFALYTTSDNPFTIDGLIDFRNLYSPTANLKLQARNYTLLDAKRTRESLVYGKVLVDVDATVKGPVNALTMRGRMNLLSSTDVAYVWTNSPFMVEDRMDGLVTFASFNDTLTVQPEEEVPVMSLEGVNMNMLLHVDDGVRLRADLSTDRSKFVELVGSGDLNLQYSAAGDINLNGRYTLTDGTLKYSLPVIPLEEFKFVNGSFIEWHGNPMSPNLSLKATEKKRASVDSEGGGTRNVTFETSISITGNLDAPGLVFDMDAPDDPTIQNELQTMGAEERSKQAIAMMATGIYLKNGLGSNGLSMGSALNSVLQSQINSLAGSALASANASFSMGVENRTSGETGGTTTDYSFRYSQRFFGDRFQINIGGKVSTGANATNDVGSFIDNISLEYRLDNSGTRYVRVFHNKNYESVLDGEITETGAGLVLRRKVDKLSELFIFRRKKKNE